MYKPGSADTLHSTKQTLTSPADVSVTLPLTTPARLPKSATTASLVSRLKPRRPTPSRRFLGPVGPPLPHSQSTGNVSSQRSAPEISIADAILESRMTQDEIDLLNQVQKEVVQNHNRLRARYGSPHLSPASASSDGENHAMPGLQARRPDAVPLAVDTALANAAARQKAEQTHAVSNNSNDGTTEEDSINPKHVRVPGLNVIESMPDARRSILSRIFHTGQDATLPSVTD